MKNINKIPVLTLILLIVFSLNINAQVKKFLFDATKYQTAGNADWVIDEDNSSGSYVAQRYPTPAQSTVTSSTPETYWTGGISSWGIALVKLGYQVETLPVGTAITYGNSSNPQDLSNYNVYIVDEPNSPYTATEKTAIIAFVQHGGGLLMISDHVGADRNGDGWDALRVWNDFLRNNSYGSLIFGFKVDSNNITENSSNVWTNMATNPVLNGPQGAVTDIAYHNGATLTLYPTINSSVQGLIWRNSYTQSTTNVMCATSTYGTGRIFVIGDSSPQDDGTGSLGHTLYSSWLTELSGNHARLHLNACLWLAKVTGVNRVEENNSIPTGFVLHQNYPNPFNPSTKIKFEIPQVSGIENQLVKLTIYDVLGNEVETLVNERLTSGVYEVSFIGNNISSGTYIYKLTAGSYSEVKRMTLLK